MTETAVRAEHATIEAVVNVNAPSPNWDIMIRPNGTEPLGVDLSGTEIKAADNGERLTAGISQWVQYAAPPEPESTPEPTPKPTPEPTSTPARPQQQQAQTENTAEKVPTPEAPAPAPPQQQRQAQPEPTPEPTQENTAETVPSPAEEPTPGQQHAAGDPFSVSWQPPSNHDGTSFTFPLSLSERPEGFSYRYLKFTAIGAENGKVLKAKRAKNEGARNQHWDITVRPLSNASALLRFFGPDIKAYDDGECLETSLSTRVEGP